MLEIVRSWRSYVLLRPKSLCHSKQGGKLRQYDLLEEESVQSRFVSALGPGCVKTQKTEIFMGTVTPPDLEKIA